MAKSRFSHLEGPVVPNKQATQEQGPKEIQGAEAESAVVQLNLKVSPALRSALRMKALKLGIPLTEAVRPLLQAWAEEE